jgi:serine phosphatase RsbU (regulator of sigma subunit)
MQPMGRRWGIRALVTVLVMTPLVVVIAVMLGLLITTSHRIAEDLGQTAVDNATRTIADETDRYLASAVRVSNLYARRVERGTLAPTGLTAWETSLLDDLIVSSRVDSICFANPTGETTWLLRGAGGRLELGRVPGPGPDQASEFVISDAGVIEPEPLRSYQFVATSRPWWSAAMDRNTPVWSPVYFWFGERGGAITTGTGYTRKLTGPEGTFAGVLVVDVTLGALSRFLERLPVAESGEVYIVDGDGIVVASSTGGVTTPEGERVALSDHASPMAREVATTLGPPESWARKPQTIRARVASSYARIRALPIASQPGLDWVAIVILPESSFLGQAQAIQQRAILAGLVTLVGAAVLGWLVSRRLAQPVQQLSEHVRKVGSGDFAARIELKSTRELETLSSELNKMSAGLRQRVELERALEVAREVQQSLLPEGDPDLKRLDVVGRARYCESTGGDYYDFINVSYTSSGTLIALGDVMGHGIGSALLMATARAALRAYADEGHELAELLNRVNRVLAADARHGRFMTLEVALIDPAQGTIRWASAGHDPIMVYHPDRDEFEELGTEDIPLGIDAAWAYKEHTAGGLRPGAIIMMGTDGIWETRSASNEFYGKDRIKAIIRKKRDATAEAISVALEADVRAFRGEADKLDDLTYVAIKIKPEPAPVGVPLATLMAAKA